MGAAEDVYDGTAVESLWDALGFFIFTGYVNLMNMQVGLARWEQGVTKSDVEEQVALIQKGLEFIEENLPEDKPDVDSLDFLLHMWLEELQTVKLCDEDERHLRIFDFPFRVEKDIKQYEEARDSEKEAAIAKKVAELEADGYVNLGVARSRSLSELEIMREEYEDTVVVCDRVLLGKPKEAEDEVS